MVPPRDDRRPLPTPDDTITDPACGTGGFLLAAFDHIQRHHGSALTPDQRRRLANGAITGTELVDGTARLAAMNMLLHGCRHRLTSASSLNLINDRGFDALDPKWSGGAPRRIDEQTRDWICVIARCDPRFLGKPFSCWSLTKLRDYLIAAGYVTTISVETVRRVLHERGVSWQATKTWKASTDPDFTIKMRRILDLYDHPPADGRVLCVDEFGPLNLQPRPGRAWRPVGQPVRLRATYHRDHGVRHMIAALDLSTGKLHYRIRDRKRRREFLSFLKTLRARWPDQHLYLILDNFSPHKHPEVRSWCAANQVDLVFLPTYASWLNWIEAEFAAVRYFALDGTDHRTHAEQDAAIGAYIRWRNHHAKPKTSFATRSKIRHPDYPFKAA